MKYVSTRGNIVSQTFSNLLLEGIVSDGGLVMPEFFPKISSQKLESWRYLSYSDLACEILSLFLVDIPIQDLRLLTKAAYEKGLFRTKNVVKLHPLIDNIYLLCLSEGPTLAFKDIAMQFLGHIFEYILKNSDSKNLNIIGATSGDTGSAAEYALRNKKKISVFMLSPYGRMSTFQRAQMYSLQDKNIHNIAIRGVFDEAQDIVKSFLVDLDFKFKYNLAVVNSINWIRIAAQVVYYFYGWLLVTKRPNQEVSFAVPSGNFGNILSGHVARNMGLPIRNLILATNENNVLEEFFKTGIYRPRSPQDTYITSSPSMDISRASNFERFVFHLVDKDSEYVKKLWISLLKKGFFDLSDLKPLFNNKYGFLAGSSSHQDRINTIRYIYNSTSMIIDPHTADGIKVAREFLEPDVPMIALETALPQKFPNTIKEALGRVAPLSPNLKKIEVLPQHFKIMACDKSAIKEYIETYARCD